MPRSFIPLLLSISLAASVARADAVPPPPECPRGTVPETDHLGTVCLEAPPASCPPGSTPAATRAGPLCLVDSPQRKCREHETRREVGLCVATVDVPTFGGPRPLEAARGTCAADRTCPEGSTCTVELRCAQEAPPAPATPESPARACHCAQVGARSDARPLLALVLGLAVLLGRRRGRA